MNTCHCGGQVVPCPELNDEGWTDIPTSEDCGEVATKHTPEPWRWDEGTMSIVADVPPDWWVDDGDPPPVTSVAYLRGACGGGDGDVGRIVACVNALQGVVDPVTELSRLRKVEEAARRLVTDRPGYPSLLTMYHEADSCENPDNCGHCRRVGALRAALG